MEGAGVNAGRRLLGEEALRRCQLVQPGQRLAGLSRLPRRVTGGERAGAVATSAPAEEVDGRPALHRQPAVVGGALVGEVGASWQRAMDGEVPQVAKYFPQHRVGGVRLNAAVK